MGIGPGEELVVTFFKIIIYMTLGSILKRVGRSNIWVRGERESKDSVKSECSAVQSFPMIIVEKKSF